MKKLTKQEILEQIKAEETKLTELTVRAKEYDPFWYWIPNDGVVTDDGREVLARYLKEEDIPSKVDGQLDRLLSKSKINGTSGGNQSGKTDVETIDGIIKATGELPNSMKEYEGQFEDIIRRAKNKVVRGRVTAVDNKQLHRVVLATWQKYIPKQYLKGGDWDKSYSKEFDILTLYRGKKPCATIEYLTNEQAVKSAQGNPLDWAKFDEEPDKAKWKETLMRFITSGNPDIGIAWTPTEGLTWATDLFHDGVLDGESVGNTTNLFKFTPVCNPYVNKETLIKIFDEFAKVSSYDEMRMRLLGDAISLSGLVYSGLFSNTHIIEPFWDELSTLRRKDYLVLTGLDPHTVTATAMVFILIDREGIAYIDRCYFKESDTDEIKRDFWATVVSNGYRTGFSVCDKSADSSIIAFGGRNIFEEIKRNTYYSDKRYDGINSGSLAVQYKGIPTLRTSEKFEGSVKAGIDTIKRRLKENRLFVVNRPENQELIKSFRTLERDTFNNEDKRGTKDRINEGRHHLHAATRYVFQYPINWYPEKIYTPEPVMFDEAACW